MQNQDLFKAISDRNFDGLDEYTSGGGDVNAFLLDGMSPLVFTLTRYFSEEENSTFDAIILRLLDAGSDVNAIHPVNGKTATMLAIMRKRSEEIIMKFINAVTDVNRKCKYGDTLLIYAIENGYGKPVISELLIKGADPDYPTVSPKSPINCAVSVDNSNPDVIELLLNAGADMNSIDVEYKPLIAKCCRGRCKPDEVCRYKRVVDVLVKKGADLKAVDGNGDTIIHLTTCNYVTHLAIKAGVSIETKNNDKMTPLIQSLIFNNMERVNDLLLRGANPNSSNDLGCSSLYYWWVMSFEPYSSVLLFHGADVLIKNIDSIEPLDVIYHDKDIYGFVNKKPGIRELIKHYLLFVNETGLDDGVERLESVRREYFLDFIAGCKKELRNMRNVFLKDKMSIYDFCQAIKIYGYNFTPIKIQEYTCDYERILINFPIYKNFILMRIRYSSSRNFKFNFLKKLEQIFISVSVESETVFIIPDCLYLIGKYLSSRQLYTLFLASLDD